MGRLFKDDSGFALILTILIISLIVAVTLQFNTSMWSDLHAAANLGDGIKLSCIARSGFNGALAVLSEDDPAIDTLHDDWANTGALSAYSSAIFEDGSFKVNIIDHAGKININQLVYDEGKNKGEFNLPQKELLKRFLESPEFGLDSEEVEAIISAIKDWIDEDDVETGIYGAEGSYYQALEKPYSCKDAPIEFLEELLLVKGVTKELYYGTKEKPGISNYLTTVHGDGKININTADSLVLMALSKDIEEDVVEDMLAYRENEENKDSLTVEGWGKAAGFGDFIPKDLITDKSNYFEVISEGIKEAMSKRITGIIERSKGSDPPKILSWKVE